MAVNIDYPPGATPLDADDILGLIPAGITLQRQLDEFEEANILEATTWAFSRHRGDPLDEEFLFTVHRRMFDRTWQWAGQPRTTDKNIGCPSHEVRLRLRQMLQDVRAQIEHRSYPPHEIAARYHHRLVAIHVFPNGNGRHARLMADLLLKRLTDERFTWGSDPLMADTELRHRYIAALRAADAGDYTRLFSFLTIDSTH